MHSDQLNPDEVDVMAARPIFVPQMEGSALVTEIPIEFKWNPGMAPIQKKKNIAALHSAAKERGFSCLLEISSKSELELGRRLSAFSLKLTLEGAQEFPLECVYQGSKVFRNGGPYTDLFTATPREAKRDTRLKSSGELIGFSLMRKDFPLSPKNAFYDWLYLKCLYPHCDWIAERVSYKGYTDIEFNPSKSVNCQARAFAELMSLVQRRLLTQVVHDFEFFSKLLPPL